jgi:hypothetical protein
MFAMLISAVTVFAQGAVTSEPSTAGFVIDLGTFTGIVALISAIVTQILKVIPAISGSKLAKIGVSVACQRLYHALRHTHTVKIVDMKTRNNVMAFEDDLLTDKYRDFDVLLLKKVQPLYDLVGNSKKKKLKSLLPNLNTVLRHQKCRSSLTNSISSWLNYNKQNLIVMSNNLKNSKQVLK